MKTITLLSAGLAVTFIALLPSTPAQALKRTWVSNGGGGSTCSLALPCGTFQLAHNATDEGGIISCLNSGDFGTVVIDRGITIDCSDVTIQSGAAAAGVIVNAPGASVTLRGLAIDGSSFGGTGIGVHLINGVLQVENCRISRWLGSIGNGIRFNPTVPSKLYVSDSVISHNGQTASGGGIIIQPSGSGAAALVVLNRVQAVNNFHGILADGTGSSGGLILVDVRDSFVAQNRGHGIAAISSAGASLTAMVVDRTSSVINGASGIFSQAATVHLGNSTVTGNTTGLNVAGGQILSYQNNQTSGNFTDGAPTGVLTLR
jgi:hypothetical protein